MHIETGKWDVIHRTHSLSETDWPLPDFGAIDSLNPNIAYRRRYENGQIDGIGVRWTVPPSEVAGLPRDGFGGAEYIELRMNRLLHHTKKV